MKRFTPLVTLLLAGCPGLCGTDFDAVRYGANGEVVERYENASDWSAEGGCISFHQGCESETQLICGNVAVVRR